MADVIRGKTDRIVRVFLKALEAYEREHPGSKTSVYRQNSGSIRIRVVDDGMKEFSSWERHDRAWEFIQAHVDEDSIEELSMLVVVTRKELKKSLANLAFEDPLPSAL